MGEQKSKGPKIVLCTVIAFVGMLLGGVANTAGYPLIKAAEMACKKIVLKSSEVEKVLV